VGTFPQCGCHGQYFTDPIQLAACEGWPVLDSVTPDSVLMGYAASGGCPSSGSETWPVTLAAAMMRANRAMYSKVSAQDCGSSTISGAGTDLTIGMINKSVTAVNTLAVAAIGVPIVGPLIGLAITGVEDIIKHHAQAVANEQRTICATVNAFNQFEAQLESKIASGGITLENAIALCNQAVTQITSALNSISNGKHDAPWGWALAIGSLGLYLQAMVYPTLVPAPATVASELSGSTSVAGVAVPNYALWIGGGLILAKLLGVI